MTEVGHLLDVDDLTLCQDVPWQPPAGRTDLPPCMSCLVVVASGRAWAVYPGRPDQPRRDHPDS